MPADSPSWPRRGAALGHTSRRAHVAVGGVRVKQAQKVQVERASDSLGQQVRNHDALGHVAQRKRLSKRITSDKVAQAETLQRA